MHAPVKRLNAIKLIAAFEAFKGVVVLLAASGLLAVIHKDLHGIASVIVEHLHLNPASKFPRIFIEAAGHLQDTRLVLLAIGAAAYASLRLAEAYGLYHGRAWAEVLAAGSGGLYVPFEVLGLLRDPTWHGAALLVINLVVVAVMVLALLRRRKPAQRPDQVHEAT